MSASPARSSRFSNNGRGFSAREHLFCATMGLRGIQMSKRLREWQLSRARAARVEKPAAPPDPVEKFAEQGRRRTLTMRPACHPACFETAPSAPLSSRPLPLRSLCEPLRSQRNLGLPSAQHEGEE